MRKLNIKKKSLVFSFRKLSSNCTADLIIENNREGDDDKLIYIEDVAKHLIRRVTEAQHSFEAHLIKAFGVIYILSMLILRYHTFNSNKNA